MTVIALGPWDLGTQCLPLLSTPLLLGLSLQRNKKEKKAVKEKTVIQVDLKDPPTLEGKSYIYVIAKDFPYPEFVEYELMTSTLLKHPR